MSRKKCIILSNGPLPTPEHTKVEGGGLRCWGLAQGMLANDPSLEVTVAYHESYRQHKFTDKYKGATIATWSLDNIHELISEFDSILVSYCMGDLSVKVADSIRPDQQLVLDCYVPIYVEVSARNSDDLDNEYSIFSGDVKKWDHVLRRGDIFLCASDTQKRFYQGVLSALGRVNPATYNQEMILIVPYGIYRDGPKSNVRPITKVVGKNDKKVLWFGGIYPWFDLKQLADSIKIVDQDIPTKLVIVGARNPFNTHPDFVRRYEDLTEYVNSDKKLKELVVFQDWVAFEERADWYLDSDMVVVMNQLGDENELAWRTRLVDFMWANLTIVTNGGDPLGEYLINKQAAARISGKTSSTIAKDISTVLGNPKQIQELKDNLSKVKQEYFWDTITKKLVNVVNDHRRATDLERYGLVDIELPSASTKHQVKKALHKAKMLPAYYQKYGGRNTYHALRTTLGNQVAKVKRKTGVGGDSGSPRIIFVAHQLDMSGAPFVFIDMFKQFKKTNKRLPVEFHTFNPTHGDNLRKLNQLGIKPKLHMSKDIGLQYNNGDVLVLNTVAHSLTFKATMFEALENGKLRQLIWYIHEDEPNLIFKSNEKKRIKNLLDSGKIIVYSAAKQTVDNYQKIFENKSGIRMQPYHLVYDKKHHRVREAKNFDKISFILPGTIGDGRKGQLPIFYAFASFLENYYNKSPNKYRKFELVYVGMYSDFLSRQLLNHANALGGHFKHHGVVTHQKVLDIVMNSNITICYSMRECLPVFVFEGMLAGHPILRNNSSGMHEQLNDGKNGFYLDSNDYYQVVSTLEKVMNKSKTSNNELANMSKESYKLAKSQENHSYNPMIEAITDAFEKD